VKKIIALFVLGLAVGCIVAVLFSARNAGDDRLENYFRKAVEHRDLAAVTTLSDEVLEHWAGRYEKILELGRLLLALEDPDLIESFYRRVAEAAPPDSPAAVECHIMFANAALQRNDDAEAVRQFRLVTEKYWDYPQALQAEEGLRWLEGRRYLRQIREAADKQDWAGIVEMFNEFPFDHFIQNDLYDAASFYFIALLATGRLERAAESLRDMATEDSGVHLPSVINPSMLKHHQNAEVVLSRTLALLAPDNRWRDDIACVIAALRDDWPRLQQLWLQVDPMTLVNTVDAALAREHTGDRSAAVMQLAEKREDLNDPHRLHLLVVLSQYLLEKQNYEQAARIVAEGEKLREETNTFAQLLNIKAGLLAREDIDEALAMLGREAETYRNNQVMVLMLLNEGLNLLRRRELYEKMCDFAKKYIDLVEDADKREQLLQVCSSS